jgi:hypothetical protein
VTGNVPAPADDGQNELDETPVPDHPLDPTVYVLLGDKRAQAAFSHRGPGGVNAALNGFVTVIVTEVVKVGHPVFWGSKE